MSTVNNTWYEYLKTFWYYYSAACVGMSFKYDTYGTLRLTAYDLVAFLVVLPLVMWLIDKPWKHA